MSHGLICVTSLENVPPGNLLHSYRKWPFIVDLPIISIVTLVYQRVFAGDYLPNTWVM